MYLINDNITKNLAISKYKMLSTASYNTQLPDPQNIIMGLQTHGNSNPRSNITSTTLSLENNNKNKITLPPISAIINNSRSNSVANINEYSTTSDDEKYLRNATLISRPQISSVNEHSLQPQYPASAPPLVMGIRHEYPGAVPSPVQTPIGSPSQAVYMLPTAVQDPQQRRYYYYLSQMQQQQQIQGIPTGNVQTQQPIPTNVSPNTSNATIVQQQYNRYPVVVTLPNASELKPIIQSVSPLPLQQMQQYHNESQLPNSSTMITSNNTQHDTKDKIKKPLPNSGRIAVPSNIQSNLTLAVKLRKQCPVCGKICSRPSTLKTHYLIHTGDRPFKCSWKRCKKSFNVKSNMLRHLKSHQKISGAVELENSTTTSDKEKDENEETK